MAADYARPSGRVHVLGANGRGHVVLLLTIAILALRAALRQDGGSRCLSGKLQLRPPMWSGLIFPEPVPRHVEPTARILQRFEATIPSPAEGAPSHRRVGVSLPLVCASVRDRQCGTGVSVVIAEPGQKSGGWWIGAGLCECMSI